MRKTTVLLFFILIPFAFAEVEISESLNINSSVTVYGKTLTILGAESNGKLKVSVDGVEGIVKPTVNRTTNVNEMFVEILNFTYIDPETIDTILKITVNYECGDDICNISETSAICCTDCGCEGYLKCINNICQKEECVINADCEDNNLCTIDECSLTPPRTCSNTLITECINNDSCCPATCGSENDTDCIEINEEIPIEETFEAEPEVEKFEIVIEEIKKKTDLTREEKKGVFVTVGVAFLVIIIGLLIFLKKHNRKL